MARSGALLFVVGMTMAVSRAVGTPPPPPGGYVYYNTSPGVVGISGALVDEATREIFVGATVDGAVTDVGALESRVYAEAGTGNLEFAYRVTPATGGEMFHSVDVPWVNNEVALTGAGYVSDGVGEILPVAIARYNDRDPVTFLFDYSPVPGASNLDGGTAWMVMETDAHAYEWSEGLVGRALVDGGFEVTNGLGGYVPEHAPEAGSLGVLVVGVMGLCVGRGRGGNCG